MFYIYIYAFSRRFYPKRLTLHSSYSFTFDQLPAESFQNLLLFQPFVAPVPTFLRPVAGIKFNIRSLVDKSVKFLSLNICYVLYLLFFCYQHFFFTHNPTQHPKYNKTKQQTHTQHLKVQSKGRERGKDNKNTKVTPLYNHVYQTKNTAKHQWSKAWPHRLAPLHIHKSLFAGGYGSNMFFHTCAV